MDDSKIIELFFERSEQAIAEMSNKYGTGCIKVAENILKNPSDAEECVNDAYLGAWNTIPPNKPDPLSSYVYRIVRNLSIKRYHQNTAQKRNSYYDVALDELEYCISDTDSVEENYNLKELSLLINDFLNTLKKDDRVMFVKRYWFSDSISDIAKIFNTSNHNITVRLSRVRRMLKKFLIKKGVLYEA